MLELGSRGRRRLVAVTVVTVVTASAVRPGFADPPQDQPDAPPAGDAGPADTPQEAPVPADSPARLLPWDQPYPPVVKKGPLRAPLVWEGQRFSTADWIITGAATGVAIASVIIHPRGNHWIGGFLFDDGARNAFRLSSSQTRFIARDASDVILSLEATWPLFVDSLISAWWYHGSPDVAAQMALIDSQALAIIFALQGTTTILTSRQRPYGVDCGKPFLPNGVNDCEDSNVRYRGFFSGHSSIAFMSAGLICVHHLKLGLFGNKTADAMSCVVAYAGATTTALLRTMGDVHYMSDVIIGAFVGTLVGVGLPLLHYRKPRDSRRPDEREGVNVTLIPFGVGLGIGGTY